MDETTEPVEGSTKYPTATGVRVLRLIEYVYADAESAAQDMALWTQSKVVRGEARVDAPPRMIMRSTVLPFSSIQWAEPT